MKKICSVSLLILMFTVINPAHAGMKKYGQAGMTFLNIGGSARASGMANVFDFAHNDLGSVFYNPAGLATVENRTFYFNYTQWIADMSVSHIAFSWDFGRVGVFALHGQFMDYGDFQGTVIDPTISAGYRDIDINDVSAMSIGLSYGKSLTDKFSIGGTVKYIGQKLGHVDTYVGDAMETSNKANEISGVAFDFGTLYDVGIRSLILSMSIRNYAAQQLYENEEFQIPQTYKIGIAADLIELFSSPSESHKILTAVEWVDSREHPQYLNVGVEYTWIEMVSLRFGWNSNRNQDNLSAYSLGAGYMFNSSSFLGRIDLSYSAFDSDLGNVLRFSLSGSF